MGQGQPRDAARGLSTAVRGATPFSPPHTALARPPSYRRRPVSRGVGLRPNLDHVPSQHGPAPPMTFALDAPSPIRLSGLQSGTHTTISLPAKNSPRTTVWCYEPGIHGPSLVVPVKTGIHGATAAHTNPHPTCHSRAKRRTSRPSSDRPRSSLNSTRPAPTSSYR